MSLSAEVVKRLAAVLLALTALPGHAETTVWLVRPLYPGQEALVDRTEKALDKLLVGEARKANLIGQKDLAAALKGSKVDDVPCLSGDRRCPDPIDPFVAALGFDRVVLIQGGQDETGFKFRAVSYEPRTGKSYPASATNPVLERALLGAVAKVVPVASSLEVKSTPPGAAVYVDDVKVGTTPLITQVLPGERVIRLDLKLHQPVEETIIIPIRGVAALEKTLEKVAARIVITASPAGTNIYIDGQNLGKDKVDRGILPGTHTIRLTAENHKAFEQTVQVKADEQYSLDKTLEPLPGVVLAPQPGVGPPPPMPVVPGALPGGSPGGPAQTPIVVKVETPGGPLAVKDPGPPPPPKSDTDLTYDKQTYVQFFWDRGELLGDTQVSRRFGDAGFGRTERFTQGNRTLMGGGFEFGTFFGKSDVGAGKLFGLAIFGASYLTNITGWGLTVGWAQAPNQRAGCGEGNFPNTYAQCGELISGRPAERELRDVRMHMVTIRALQPMFRVAFWRFQLSLQVGAELRTGNIVGTSDPVFNDGFLILDLLLAGRFNARLYLVEGLYLFGSGHYQHLLWSETTAGKFDDDGNQVPGVRSSSGWGLNAGLGYGF